MARKDGNEEDVRALRNEGYSERDAILKSVKRTKKERKKMAKGMAMPSSMSYEEYPYGTRIELDEETLQKLGIKDLPNAGEKLCLEADVTVIGSSENTSSSSGEKKKTYRSVTLQITKMCLEPEG